MSHPKSQSPPANSMKKRQKNEDRYARVVIFGNIRHKIPTKLKMSPISMIPHKRKAYRCILDLSLHIRLKQKLFESVSTHTNKQSKAEVMVQLGLALKRLTSTMAYQHDPELPLLFSKIDIKDRILSHVRQLQGCLECFYVIPLMNLVESIDDI